MEFMRETIIIHSRLAWRQARGAAAVTRQHGVQALSVEQLAARLAGGFLKPIGPDALKAAITKAVSADLGELNGIKELPGFARAAAATLSKAWAAGLKFSGGAVTEGAIGASRLESVARLETEVLRHLPDSMLRPADLVAAALSRLDHGKVLFGRISLQGRTEAEPVWRPLLAALGEVMDVRWVAGPRYVPSWVSDLGIPIIRKPPENPKILCESCASSRHEALEALRWARSLLAGGQVRPEEIAIATASPEEWDDHFLALSEMSGLDLHFVHGRKVLTTPEGQLAAALGELLLRGFSQARMTRLIALLRTQNPEFEIVPGDWWRTLPQDAPLLDAARWRDVLGTLQGADIEIGEPARLRLREIVDTLALGLKQAQEIGERLLRGRGLAIWRKALTEGPPAALDVTLATLRLPDEVAPESSVIWAPAASLGAEPRPYVRLIGLTSRSWPRRQSEDPLLPNHVVPSGLLDPLPIHEADRRDFDTIVKTTACQVICSYARRDAQGRINGLSPLYPKSNPRLHRQRARIPQHAAGWSDRLFARPGEFKLLPVARSAVSCWIDWHTDRLTAHDGLVRRNHPLVIAALNRRQSATSLARLLRDPLGYLWTYGFRWDELQETEEPLLLDALAFGNLLHATLEGAVNRLEAMRPGGFGAGDAAAISNAIVAALREVAVDWEGRYPIPPPVIWHRKLQDVQALAAAALSFSEDPLPDQRSWAEIPFGGDPHAETLSAELRAQLPWDPLKTVVIPGTTVAIGGSIDRLDLSGSGSSARVTDYKSGKPPGRRKEPVLKGGSELQRCLYAFAVRTLVAGINEVEGRLLYPKGIDGGLYVLPAPGDVLGQLASFVGAAQRYLLAGDLLPGAGAEDGFNDLAFALPGGAKESYFELKHALVIERLSDLAPLWEME
jgi:hypothetical protein